MPEVEDQYEQLTEDIIQALEALDRRSPATAQPRAWPEVVPSDLDYNEFFQFQLQQYLENVGIPVGRERKRSD